MSQNGGGGVLQGETAGTFKYLDDARGHRPSARYDPVRVVPSWSSRFHHFLITGTMDAVQYDQGGR